jgi:tetratricopeptide (TPR) repeat protein
MDTVSGRMKQKKKKRTKRKLPKAQNEILACQKGEHALASGQFDQATSYFKGISKSSPNYGRACKGHGTALLKMRRWSEALAVLQTAHEALPDDPDIVVDGADAVRLLGDLCSAEDLYIEARKRGADGFQIRFGEASICQERKLWIEAIKLWTELGISYPDNPYVLQNLGKAWHELGETDKAVSLMLEAFESGGGTIALSMLGVLAPHAGSCGHEEVQRIRTYLGEQLKLEEGNPTDYGHCRKENGRVNIGYVSAFFHRRNWMKPVWALLNNHDRENFNIHLFADGPPDDINTEGGYVPHTQDTIYDVRKLGNRDLARLISDCDIEVLVDLNGYSAVRRLGLWTAKPSPVTIGWFNQYATSGMPGIEWLIGDDVVICPEEEKFYSERIIRLKQSYLTFQVGYATPDIEIPVDDEPFTFGCLGSAYKITPEVRAAWIRLLSETNGTRLLVRNRVLGEESHRKWFLDFFTSEEIDSERVILLGPTEHEEFLQTYGKVDLALDTFPYNGGTTTMEALWQGVPLICFKGDRWVSRTSATLLNSAGLYDFVGEDEKEYVDIAKKWSAPEQKSKLRKLRTEMRGRLENSTVCDGAGLAQNFERIVFEIIR